MMADDIEALGAQKKSDVLNAQREVLNEVQRLDGDGKITIDRDQKRQVS
jgi:flagellar motor switch protein FliG